MAQSSNYLGRKTQQKNSEIITKADGALSPSAFLTYPISPS